MFMAPMIGDSPLSLKSGKRALGGAPFLCNMVFEVLLPMASGSPTAPLLRILRLRRTVHPVAAARRVLRSRHSGIHTLIKKGLRGLRASL